MTKMKDGIHIPEDGHQALVQQMLRAAEPRPARSLTRRLWPYGAVAAAASLALIALLRPVDPTPVVTEDLAWEALDRGALNLTDEDVSILLNDDEFETLLADLTQD